VKDKRPKRGTTDPPSFQAKGKKYKAFSCCVVDFGGKKNDVLLKTMIGRLFKWTKKTQKYADLLLIEKNE
jgi:hypothetical protein